MIFVKLNPVLNGGLLVILPNNIKEATEVLRKDNSPLWGYFNNKENDVCWIDK